MSILTREFYEPGSATTSHSFSITLGAGVARKLVVTIGRESTAGSVSALTFDGTSFVANAAIAFQHPTNSQMNLGQYWYDIPDAKGTGSYTIAFTTGASISLVSAQAVIADGMATGTAEATQTASAVDGVAAVGPVSVTATTDAVLIAGAAGSFTTPTIAWSGDVTERSESTNSGYRAGYADAADVASGSRTATATYSNTASGDKIIVLGSYAAAAPAGPTITGQPVADTVILSNETTASFSVTATGTGTLLYDWELEDGVGSGVYANLANGNGATWTGQTAASCSATLTAKTLTGRRVRCNVTDDNGTTTTNAVALTIWDGPQVTTFPATDGDGESTATLTSDYVTGVGEAIEVRIPLSDGDVAVTVTTT